MSEQQGKIEKLLVESHATQILSDLKAFVKHGWSTLKDKFWNWYEDAKGMVGFEDAYHVLVRKGVVQEADDRTKEALKQMYTSLDTHPLREGVSHVTGITLTVAGYLYIISMIFHEFSDSVGLAILWTISFSISFVPVLAHIVNAWINDSENKDRIRRYQ